MKTALGYIALGFAAIAAVGLGSWLGLRYKVLPFIQLPGIYDCGTFGIPTPAFHQLEIDPEFKVFTTNVEGNRVLVGDLRNYDSKRGRLEMTMEIVHTPDLTLEPMTRNLIEGTTLGIRFIKLKDGAETGGAFCKRIRKLEPAL